MMWHDFLHYLAKRREYREAQLVERCVVYPPPRTNGEAIVRRLDRESVEWFLAKCEADWQTHRYARRG